MATDDRRCINCGDVAGNSGSDPYLIFFCEACNSEQTPKIRNNVFVAWIRARMDQTQDCSLLSGQCDENWPERFPHCVPTP